MLPEISARELAELQIGEDPPQIIDVREPNEFAFCRLEGAELKPLGQIHAWAAELDPEADLVLMCHTGFRSGQAVMFLRQMGFKRARNLRGGIDAWSAQVDPMVPRY
jgi:rhodanese-related sulfurtransferase